MHVRSACVSTCLSQGHEEPGIEPPIFGSQHIHQQMQVPETIENQTLWSPRTFYICDGGKEEDLGKARTASHISNTIFHSIQNSNVRSAVRDGPDTWKTITSLPSSALCSQLPWESTGNHKQQQQQQPVGTTDGEQWEEAEEEKVETPHSSRRSNN